MIAKRLQPFGTTIFSEMTQAAIQHGAINLSQGYPDFEGPAEIMEAARGALLAGHNQYARSMGHPKLVGAISQRLAADYGLQVDPLTQIGVTSGATEAISAFMLGFVDPGDEVILIEPYYDSYPATVAMAGGRCRCVTLQFPDFELDAEALEAAVTDKTRLLILNNPHNPTGKVFSKAELGVIAAFAQRHNLMVLSDEVSDHLTFDGATHTPLCTLPGMWERTYTVSSTGKTFSFTGWKIGWGYGPAALVKAAQSAHQFLTYCSATPLQVAMALALEAFRGDYIKDLVATYDAQRQILMEGLVAAGFQVAPPAGTYFALADFSALSQEKDRAFAHRLIKEAGVATIPPSVFYQGDPGAGQNLLRFAFCKRPKTLEAALERLLAWAAKNAPDR
jgi:N-succinyldiaminopimelate aminotransferase